MAQYSPWYEEYTKYPYRNNPTSLRTRYKNFIVWFLKSYWFLLAFTVIGFLAISLEAFLQSHWYVWIFKNPFSDDVFANNTISIFAMSLAWISAIPIFLLYISSIYAIPKQAEEMLPSPSDTSAIGDWIRRSYELMPIAFFVLFCLAGAGMGKVAAFIVWFVICMGCISWYPIYEKYFHHGNHNQ